MNSIPPPKSGSSVAIPVEAPVENISPGGRRWQVGTLVYTSGGLAVLFFWLLFGDFAVNLKDRAIQPVAMLMLRGFQAPDWLVGILVGSIPAGIGMLIAPVISVLSDKHRGRWGRRIPFLFISTPVAAAGMLGLAWAPALGSALHSALAGRSPGEMVCQTIAFSMFWGVFEIATAVLHALFVALINDVVPKVIIGRFFAFFRAVGLLAGITFGYFIMGKAASHAWEILVGLALIFGVSFSLTCLMVKEGRYGDPQQEAAPRKHRPSASIKAYFRLCFTEPFYLWLFLANTLGSLALGPVNAFSVFHAQSLGLREDAYGKCLALSYAIGLVISYPLGSLADRFHPVRVAVGAMALYAAVTLYGFLFALDASTFGIAFVLHTIMAGVYITGTASILPRLLPDETFAQLASAGYLTISIGSMILPPCLGVLISMMNHDYNVAFIIGSVVAMASLASYLVVISKFKELGGDAGYHPPDTRSSVE